MTHSIQSCIHDPYSNSEEFSSELLKKYFSTTLIGYYRIFKSSTTQKCIIHRERVTVTYFEGICLTILLRVTQYDAVEEVNITVIMTILRM